MNDDRLGKAIGGFYRETDATPPDSRESARQVRTRLQRTPQVRRRRWLPSWLPRRTSPADTSRPTEYQPSPIPATNGHTPTVIGRTQSMFSPVKALIAAALVFGIGGAFLVAQPFQQQGSVPGAQTEDIAPTWVTGNITYAPSCSGPDIEMDGGVRRDRNYECRPQTWTASDPRFSGVVVSRWNEDVYQTDHGSVAVNMTADFLRNDEGGWACSASNLYEGSGLYPTHLTGKTATCVGQGGYEGLSAILVVDEAKVGHPFVGLIFSGDIPPLPEAPASE